MLSIEAAKKGNDHELLIIEVRMDIRGVSG